MWSYPTTDSGTLIEFDETFDDWAGDTANGDYTVEIIDSAVGFSGRVASLAITVEHNSFTCESGARQLLVEGLLGYTATDNMPDPNADVAVDSSDLVYDLSVDARP